MSPSGQGDATEIGGGTDILTLPSGLYVQSITSIIDTLINLPTKSVVEISLLVIKQNGYGATLFFGNRATSNLDTMYIYFNRNTQSKTWYKIF